MADPITCQACRATFTCCEPTDLDASFVELRLAGWLDVAWKGRGRERWAWRCPTCARMQAMTEVEA